MGGLVEFEKLRALSPRDPRYVDELERVCKLLAVELKERYEFEIVEMSEKLQFEEGCG